MIGRLIGLGLLMGMIGLTLHIVNQTDCNDTSKMNQDMVNKFGEEKMSNDCKIALSSLNLIGVIILFLGLIIAVCFMALEFIKEKETEQAWKDHRRTTLPKGWKNKTDEELK